MLSRAQPLGAAIATAGCRRSLRTTIGVIPKATSHLFFVSVRSRAEQAGKEFNLEVLWNGPQEETDHARQIQILNSKIARTVDGIAISTTDERALAGPVRNAIDRGIPVVVFDSGVNAEGYISFIATDNCGAGCTAARTLVRLAGLEARLAMVMHKPGGTSTLLREQGFEETLDA